MPTESEANETLCPIRGCNCIASACAFWRWSPVTNPSNGAQRFYVSDNTSATEERDAGQKPEGREHWQFVPCDGDPAGWLEPRSDADLRRKGYCGIAGKPEDE
jgi:hypothetical protein